MRCREFLLSHRLLNKHIWKKKGIAAQCLINRLKLEDTTKTSISIHMIDSIHMTGNNLTAVSILMTVSPYFKLCNELSKFKWRMETLKRENASYEKIKKILRQQKEKNWKNNFKVHNAKKVITVSLLMLKPHPVGWFNSMKYLSCFWEDMFSLQKVINNHMALSN